MDKHLLFSRNFGTFLLKLSNFDNFFGDQLESRKVKQKHKQKISSPILEQIILL